MTVRAPPLLALVFALAACGPEDALEPPLQPVEAGATSDTITVPACPQAGPEVICTGSGEAYTSVWRLGANAESGAELAQTFVVAGEALPRSVQLFLRPLRVVPSGGGDPILTVEIRPAPGGVVPTTSAGALAEGTVAYSALAGGAPTTIPFSRAAPLAPGAYALVLRVAAPGAGTALVGAASFASSPFPGAALRRPTRQGEGGPFREGAPPADLALTLALATPSPVTLSPASATVAIGNSLTLSASGGAAPYTYAVTSGGGTIEDGVYTAGAAPGSATVTVTDAFGTSASATITVNPALAISPASASVATNGSQSFGATGGVAPYTFSLASGGGSMSGSTYLAPAETGSAVVRVTDALGNTSAASVTVAEPAPSCTNGSSTDCNPNGATLLAGSAFVDAEPPAGWAQCAGFVNTSGDDVSGAVLDNCVGAKALRIRVWNDQGVLEDDVQQAIGPAWSAWPNGYLDGNQTLAKATVTNWNGNSLYARTDSKDACLNAAAPNGLVLGTGNASVAVVAGGNTNALEYRIGCNGSALTGRKIALYRQNAPLTIAPATADLATGAQLLLSAAGGFPPYTFTLTSGGGTVTGATYTAPATATTATVRGRDLFGQTATATFTVLAAPPCSNGSTTSCNPAGSVLIATSTFVDPQPPAGWTQCAGFFNTAGDDVTGAVLDHCIGAKELRLKAWSASGALEDDVSQPIGPTWSAWPAGNYLDGNYSLTKTVVTQWNGNAFHARTDGRDACGQVAAPSGLVLGTGNGSIAALAPGNTNDLEYRVNCGGAALPNRRIALYRKNAPLALSPVSATIGVNGSRQLDVAGGFPPYSFAVTGGGSMNGTTYLAPASATVATIAVTDVLGNTLSATITVVVPPPCTNGSTTDCNPAGATLIASSAYVDPEPPAGWTQCAGFVNTTGDDVAASVLDLCRGASKLRIRVWTQAGALEDDVHQTIGPAWSTWPAGGYLDGNASLTKVLVSRWNGGSLYSRTDGRDACNQVAAPSGLVLGTGNGGVAAIAAGNTNDLEYRVNCSGAALVDRKVAVYR